MKKDEFNAPLEDIIARKMTQEVGLDVKYKIGKPLLFLRHERVEATAGIESPNIRNRLRGHLEEWGSETFPDDTQKCFGLTRKRLSRKIILLVAGSKV